MTTITIFNGLFCEADSVVANVIDINGFRLINDNEIFADASGMSGLDRKSFLELFSTSETSRSSLAPRERERRIGWLRLALAEKLSRESNVIVQGYVSMLVGRDMPGVLNVCLISDMKDRLVLAAHSGVSDSEAREQIRRDDTARADWVVSVTDGSDPWASTLYDMVIPVSTVGVAQSAFLIVKQLTKAVMQDAAGADRAAADFVLASKAHLALSGIWHGLSVVAEDGMLSVRFGNHAAMLESLGRVLSASVAGIPGVRGVDMGVGRGYSQGDIYTRKGNRSVSVPACEPERSEYSPCRPEDCDLSAKVEAALTLQGYPVSVFAKQGQVHLTINNHKTMLEALARALCNSLEGMVGVRNIEVGIGTGYHQPALYDAARRKVALMRIADKDRSFSMSRSPRLQPPVRSFSVYDEEAWSPERERDTEVLVLDINMPGRGVLDVLRRIKRERPDIDVLVLANRDSEGDRAAYLDLGAFAYLPKPINMDILGHTLRSMSAKGRFCSP